VRPPIEPMSDIAWGRVERGLWTRLDNAPAANTERPRSTRWVWIAGASVGLAAAASLLFAILVDKPASLGPAITKATPIVEESPTRIVSSESPSTLSVGDAHLTLDPATAITMPKSNDTAVLERGGAWIAIAKRRTPFTVIAGDAVVRVVDTRFRVARFEERITVEVERGGLDVTFRGTTTHVDAGATWSSEPVVTKAITKKAPDTKPIDKPIAVSEDSRVKYERMAALEARDPASAIEGYLEIARTLNPWAEISLYAAGRLSADRGEPRAKTLLEMYVTRFPRGRNVRDVRILLDRLKGDSK
jgi:hypothetical protein